MSATALTVTTSAPAGTVLPALAAVDGANGNTFTNTGREVIEIANGAGAPITATFVTTLTYQGYAIADLAVSITNGTSKTVGPFDVALFGDVVTVTWSSGTTVTARVTKLGST